MYSKTGARVTPQGWDNNVIQELTTTAFKGPLTTHIDVRLCPAQLDDEVWNRAVLGLSLIHI